MILMKKRQEVTKQLQKLIQTEGLNHDRCLSSMCAKSAAFKIAPPSATQAPVKTLPCTFPFQSCAEEQLLVL